MRDFWQLLILCCLVTDFCAETLVRKNPILTQEHIANLDADGNGELSGAKPNHSVEVDADGNIGMSKDLADSPSVISHMLVRKSTEGQVAADGSINIVAPILVRKSMEGEDAADGRATDELGTIDGNFGISGGLVARKAAEGNAAANGNSLVRKSKEHERMEGMEADANGSGEMHSQRVDKSAQRKSMQKHLQEMTQQGERPVHNLEQEPEQQTNLKQEQHDISYNVQPQTDALMRMHSQYMVGMPPEGIDGFNESLGANQDLEEAKNESDVQVASRAQKLYGRAKYGRETLRSASLVAPDRSNNTVITSRLDHHSRHRIPVSSVPSVMQSSYRTQHTWGSSVLLHNALLHAAMLLLVLFLTLALIGAVVYFFDSFDIEIPDHQSGGSRLYKWVWEAPDPDVGVEAVAGSHVFQDYHHTDIEMTQEAITELLTTHGCLKHVQKKIPDILWDCIRQSSRFMITKDKSNILLIRDSVLVRFSYRSHLLVERVQGKREDKAHYTIPTLDKIGAESPQKAAERWCTRSLDFDALKKHVRFIESGEETDDIFQSGGLRTVERKFIVIVQLVQDDPQMPTLPGNEPLLWMPISEIESHPHIPKHIALAEVNLWVGGKLHPEADLRELEDFLKKNGVDTTGWTGMDGTNTSETLLSEISRGQCILKLEGETVKRVINLSALRLRLSGEDDTLLVEAGRRESNGAINWRMQLPGTKQQVGETIEAAAQRTCKEELGLGEEDFDMFPETTREYIKYASPSKTYPGIMTAYYMYLVTADLCDEAPLVPSADSWMIRTFRKLQRVSPRKIGTLWGQ